MKANDIDEMVDFGLKPLEVLARQLEGDLADTRHDETLHIKASMVLDYARSLKERAMELAANR
jgi:hypothetical protein